MKNKSGFTLIELSIVLVIIGLIVGGVLVGQNLIAAAEVRAQLTQIEKYNAAVNTFKGKFNALPGDMRQEIGWQFGFYIAPDAMWNGILVGHRNGDGLIEGTSSSLVGQGQCETAYFWTDITSTAAGNLIDGTFPNGGSAAFTCTNNADAVVATTVGTILPAAKIGHANYIYVYTDGTANWFGVSAITAINSLAAVTNNATIPVAQAYSMDAKVDDGLPASGNVQASYVSVYNLTFVPHTSTSGGNATSCYDTTTSTYSVTQNNGNGGNCALSFKMQ